MLTNKFLTSGIVLSIAMIAAPAFGLTLEQATYKAIENNPSVRQAIAKYQESVENTEVSRRSGFYPSIDLNAGIGHETTYDYQGTGEDVKLTRQELGIALTQPIFNGFGTTNDVRRLSAEAEAERWNAYVEIENTALEVTQAYTEVLRNRELVRLAEINLGTHDRIFQQVRTASDSGVGRQSDFSQVSARLSKAQANRLSAISNLRTAESNYLDVVGEMPPEKLIYPQPDAEMLPENLDQAIDMALKSNPAIDASRKDLEATDHYVEATKASYYPEVNFVLERNFDDNIDGREGNNDDLLAMVRLSYNLYNGGADKRNQAAATQQQVQAAEIYRNTVRQTEQQARLAWASYEAALGSKAYLRDYVASTKESQQAYTQQFSLGRRTLLDVLDSENELFEARQDYVNADYDELYAEFRLFNSQGALMSALRIYQPEGLGFNQTPVKEQRTGIVPERSISAQESQERDANVNRAPNRDDILFLDSGEQSSLGGW